MEKVFWTIYACVYDLILKGFMPYQKIIERSITALDIKKKGLYLDAGCGTGNFLLAVSTYDSEVDVVGVDFSLSMLRSARGKMQKAGFRADLKTLDLNMGLPFSEQQFNGIICSNVIYAIKKPAYLIEELARILAHNGKLVLTTPVNEPKMIPVIKEHLDHLSLKHGRFGKAVFAAQIVSVFFPLMIFLVFNILIKSNQSYNFFTEEELKLLIQRNGLIIRNFSLIYGNQNWFIVAVKKPAENMPNSWRN